MTEAHHTTPGLRREGDEGQATRPTAMAADASTSPVDWSRPIEAAHEDGRVVPVVHNGPSSIETEHTVLPRLDIYHHVFYENGRSVSPYSGWRIRNVQPTTPELDPALWDRMVALVRDIATEGGLGTGDLDWCAEARAIVADLPKPVDPDEGIARDLVRAAYPEMKPGYAGRRYQIALAAIKRGRELAAPEVSHVG